MQAFFFKLILPVIFFSAQFCRAMPLYQNPKGDCRVAFAFIAEEDLPADTIMICSEKNQGPGYYSASLNMAVCNDKLCANVLLKIFWDLAGNYIRYDTIPGNRLTKFDHKPFNDADYQKLDQILKDKNSALRLLGKEDLIDRTNLIKATTVDAVTGATPATIKNAVVEGAVYSSYTLWHYVYGAVKDSMRSHTMKIFSHDIAIKMVGSTNYDTQLFALKQFTAKDYKNCFQQLYEAIGKSAPLVKAYIISKLPLPYPELEQNRKLVSLFPDLDYYSKSIWLDRITAEEKPARVYLPMMAVYWKILDMKQMEQIRVAMKKYAIQVSVPFGSH